jgi:hypothetical protein
MFKKIVYIVLCCLCLLETKAQDTANSSGKINPSQSSDTTNSIKKTNSPTIVKPNGGSKNLTRPPIKASLYTIKIIDGKNKNVVRANVTVEDSAKVKIPNRAKARGGNTYSLYPGSRYTINVAAEGYDSLTSTYIPKKEITTLKLPVTRKDNNSPATTSPLPADTSKSNAPDTSKVNSSDTSKINAPDTSKGNSPDTSNGNPSNSTPNTTLLIAVSGIFIISLALFILSVKTRRGLRLANAKISDLTEQIKSDQQRMKENNDKAPVLQSADETGVTTPVKIIPQANETTSGTEQNEPVINKPDANAYFVCELMMTAGPRKDDFEDVDLGEDVCGCISNSNEAIVWVLDGTSDADRKARVNNSSVDDEIPTSDKKSLVYFSSRLLAQSIGNKIKKSFAKKTTESLKEIVKKIITEVKEDWQKTFDELPADDKKELVETVKHKSVIQCSTTVLVARLSINGELTAYRVGDSKMLVFENTALNGIRLVETELQEKSDEKNDRIFFSLQLNKSDQSIRFVSNIDEDDKPKKDEEERPKYQTASEKNISTIIYFSDGVGIKTQAYLKEEYKNNPESVRKEIIYQNQATEDDKSICFIEIKQTGLQ